MQKKKKKKKKKPHLLAFTSRKKYGPTFPWQPCFMAGCRKNFEGVWGEARVSGPYPLKAKKKKPMGPTEFLKVFFFFFPSYHCSHKWKAAISVA